MFNCSGSNLQCVVCRLPMKKKEEESFRPGETVNGLFHRERHETTRQ
jgi:hypothetical protein